MSYKFNAHAQSLIDNLIVDEDSDSNNEDTTNDNEYDDTDNQLDVENTTTNQPTQINTDTNNTIEIITNRSPSRKRQRDTTVSIVYQNYLRSQNTAIFDVRIKNSAKNINN